MTGEEIPDWIPVRVRFEAEDGEIVIKMDYENAMEAIRNDTSLETIRQNSKCIPTPMETSNHRTTWLCKTFHSEMRLLNRRLHHQMQPHAKTGNISGTLFRSSKVRPADFLHSTGRNLCSTFGMVARHAEHIDRYI